MKSHARRGADFYTVVAAARRSIEDLDQQIWLAESHPDGPQGSVVAMTEVLKALAVAEANELLDARHAWFERLRARECRKSKRVFVPESRHPSAEELAETLTGQCPAPPRRPLTSGEPSPAGPLSSGPGRRTRQATGPIFLSSNRRTYDRSRPHAYGPAR